MDPSIMKKLLEEDEDETTHSGAEIEAFTAALNRDIERDSSSFQNSDSDTAAFVQGSNQTSNQFPQWQTSNLDENASCQSQQGASVSQQQDINRHRCGSENQQQQLRSMNDSKINPNPDPRVQKMSTTTSTHQQAINIMNHNKQFPFALLYPVIEPQLDKDKATQLQNVYNKLKQNEISKDAFLRHMRSIVGDQLLKMAVYKLQGHQAARISQSGPNNCTSQHMQTSPMSAQLHTKVHVSSSDQSQIPFAASQVLTDPSNPNMTNNSPSKEMIHQSDFRGVQGSQMSTSSFGTVEQEPDRSFPVHGLSKQQQQHLHFPPSFATYANSVGSNYPYSSTNINTSAQSHDSQQMRQVPVHSTSQSMNTMNLPDFESKRSQSNHSHLSNNTTMQHSSSVHWQPSTDKEQQNGALSSMACVIKEQTDQPNDQHQFNSRDESDTPSSRPAPPRSITAQLELNSLLNTRMQSTSSPGGAGSIVKTPPKRPSSIGQKKPLETLGSSPPLPGKKQKVYGAFSDQSIDQLNDVTAVSGVNLMEEEEQLFSGPKEDSQVSEASRRVVQEEEERLFLQKIPLHKKLAEIMIRSGLKGVSPDIERCLSLCVEERMRGLLYNLVKLSKQRVDIEKPRHRTVITSDVGQQILMMNRKIREEWEQKQADVEKLQKINDPEGTPGVDGDKDDGRGKSFKMQQANKEEDDKMRTNAANVAARAAFGGDDMFSKWQLMAEQARQKREGVPEVPSLTQLPKEAIRNPASTMAKNSKDYMAAGARKSGKSQFAVPQSKVARSIAAKDVIAVLEREPQTLKTTLIYRVYEKMRSDVVAE